MFGAVVGGVHYDRVFFEAHALNSCEDQANVVVVLQHASAVVVGLAGDRFHFSQPVVVDPCVKMHAAGVQPDKERFVMLLGPLDEIECFRNDLAGVEVLHPLLRQRPRVRDPLFPNFAESWVGGRIIHIRRD